MGGASDGALGGSFVLRARIKFPQNINSFSTTLVSPMTETKPPSSDKLKETEMLPDLTIGKRHSKALRIPSNARLGNLATSNGQSRDTESWSPSMRCWVAEECEEKKKRT